MVQLAPLNVPLARRIQVLCVLLMVALPISLIALNFVFVFNPLLWGLYIPYLVYIFKYDYDASKEGSKRWNWVRHWNILKQFRDFFPAKVILEEPLEKNKSYLLGGHPHGVISMSVWANFLSSHAGSFEDVTGIPLRLATLKENFKVPFLRELILSFGIIDSSRETLEFNLNRNRACLLMIGGAEEVLYAGSDKEHINLVLQRRKGFVRVALRTGSALVPVFNYGENEIYTQKSFAEGSRLRALQEWIKHKTGQIFPIINGRGIFIYDYGFLPRRVPLISVIGAPIEIPKIENPTEEDISKYHELYVQKLRQMYTKYSQTHVDNLLLL
ncbi:2-acylglycerol O-acyltransferase [Acrasis kona]|uniref:Acyltransferase n=1 Tax=Acrasis kona TaxID=1008807 RepID=A0AAW2Z6I4_9EUKA